MSVHFSRFSKNNVIIQNSETNTGRNPVAELFFGPSLLSINSFSRFIFDIDLTPLQNKISDGTISYECSTNIKHYLRMKNTSSFDVSLLNDKTSIGKRRATSFDLILFRIPDNQQWDEGVGYDYSNMTDNTIPDDKSYSRRASNWYNATTMSGWTTNGLYDNTNSGTGSTVNFSALTIVDVQHFEFGNEDIEFDMTNEINAILTGSTTGVTGWGIAFYPQLENMNNLPESYSVGFFTRHTQTFYEPYLETVYDDIITDDRNLFVTHRENKLYLSVYEDGDYVNLDVNPTVSILDSSGNLVANCVGLPTCLKTKGVYEVTLPVAFNSYTTPCIFYDVWSGLELNGNSLPNIENEFVLQAYEKKIATIPNNKDSDNFAFSHYGILQNEKILNTEIRKVGVNIKKLYSMNHSANDVNAFYRAYVKEGEIEVQVQDWTKINKLSGDYYFVFDTRDKTPNQYYIDIKVNSYGSINVYKKTLMFQIVSKL